MEIGQGAAAATVVLSQSFVLLLILLSRVWFGFSRLHRLPEVPIKNRERAKSGLNRGTLYLRARKPTGFRYSVLSPSVNLWSRLLLAVPTVTILSPIWTFFLFAEG